MQKINLKTFMKPYIIYTLLFVSTITAAFAQKDEQAKAILKDVSAKYKTYDVIKTNFVYTLESAQANVKETQTGTLIAKAKTNKFKVTLYSNSKTPVVAQELISNGKEQWTYLKKDNEVQLNNVSTNDEALNPAHIFTIYEKGFKYVYTGEEKKGATSCQVIDM